MEALGARPAPLRDSSKLASAVLRPQLAAQYEGADLVRRAALLAIGLTQNQAFVDGTKRTAYSALAVFLRLNGHLFAGEPLALAKQLEAVATRTDSLQAITERFEAWLRRNVT